jgi:type I restriction enzyme, S subunit
VTDTLIPLKHIAGINERALPEDTDPDHCFRYIDIGAVGRGELVAQPQEVRFEDAPSRARRLVQQGDTIVSTVRTYLRAVWPVTAIAEQLVVSTGFAVLTPQRVDRHYFSWWVRSDPFIEEIVARSVGVSYPAINALELGELMVRVPSGVEQRVIADFLDTETARIDTLIAKKRSMVDLLDERSAGAVEVAIRALVDRDGDLPLKRCVDAVTVGIVVTPSEWYADEGVTALRGINVRPGVVDLTEVVCLTDEGHRLHSKSALRAGDIVVVRTGQAGAAAVVPPELDGANCVDLLLIRPGAMDSDFLTFVLNSDWAQKHVESNSVGSIQAHFNVGALRELPVPASPVQVQRSTVASLRRTVHRLAETRTRLERQIALLQEHRQALITAAVTGDLEVSGVAE